MDRPVVERPDEPGRPRRAVGAAAALHLDVDDGTGHDPAHPGRPAVAVDVAAGRLRSGRGRATVTRWVQSELSHLPFSRGSFAGARSSATRPALPRTRLPLALWDLHRVLVVGSRLEFTTLGAAPRDAGGPDDGVDGDHVDTWTPDRLVDVVVGAGFDVEERTLTVSGDEIGLRAVRARTLADTVAPGMRLLVCGVNPSWYSADAGVGYARPGNRFWPAAMAAGIVDADRDARAALMDHGVGMTDFVKRPSRTAAEVTSAEYRAGFARVERLVAWLRPGAVCFSGLSGWRDVVDPKAVAGPQPRGIGGRPAYVMPSTSGLNARTPLTELAHHLDRAWALGAPS